jgi:hypothetical protein
MCSVVNVMNTDSVVHLLFQLYCMKLLLMHKQKGNKVQKPKQENKPSKPKKQVQPDFAQHVSIFMFEVVRC